MRKMCSDLCDQYSSPWTKPKLAELGPSGMMYLMNSRWTFSPTHSRSKLFICCRASQLFGKSQKSTQKQINFWIKNAQNNNFNNFLPGCRCWLIHWWKFKEEPSEARFASTSSRKCSKIPKPALIPIVFEYIIYPRN